jgi:hypothetical protein
MTFHPFCHATVFEVLGMRRMAAKFIPQVLKVKQKENHLFPATEVHQCTISDANFLGNMITGNETWIYGNEPEKKAQ